MYTAASNICRRVAQAAWIERTFGILHCEKQIVKLLHSLGFRYKKTQAMLGNIAIYYKNQKNYGRSIQHQLKSLALKK